MTAAVTSAHAIQIWSAEYISNLLKVSISRIDPHSEFDSFGLESSAAVAYITAMEEWLGLRLAPEILFDYTTIASLSEYVFTLMEKSGRVDQCGASDAESHRDRD